MSDNLQALCLSAEKIAREAGAAIMQFYNAGGAKISIKSDLSPVTEADLASEKILIPALNALTPGIPIVSEESVEAGNIPDISSGTFWTIDPLDGTKEFIHRTGAFVVALALIKDGKPILGVVYHPAHDVMFSAFGAGSATKVDAKGMRHFLQLPDIHHKDLLKVLYNPSTTDPQYLTRCLKDHFNNTVDLHPEPGLLRACQVADGTADASVVAPDPSHRVRWWDIAPAQVIVESAGGTVRTLQGQELVYKDKDLCVDNALYIRPGLRVC